MAQRARRTGAANAREFLSSLRETGRFRTISQD
jgi:hypothetical protein